MSYKDFIKEWLNPKSFITVQTSGSTGTPKVIQLDKQFVLESALRTIDFFNLTPSSHLHSCISPDFIGGKMMAVRALTSNTKFTWETPSNTPEYLFNIKTPIDLMAVVPSQMIFFLENKNKLPEIKNFLIGGSPIPVALKERIANSSFNAFESYGMTETASHIALRKIERNDSPFTLLPGIKISTDKKSCLIIEFKRGEKIFTNDIAEIISYNQFFIKGRIDNVIISGAKKINPIEIENRLDAFINAPFCVCGFKDEKWGEIVVLIIQQEGSQNLKDYYQKECGKILQNWERPKEIFFVDSLPKTPSDKIFRVKSEKELESFSRILRF